jgi:ribosomal protein S18 acetylase RimI-like enzyme
MNIRPANLADAPTIAEFNIAMAKETEDITLNPAVIGPGVRAVLADLAKGFYFVAEDAGRVVGQLMITHEWSDWRNGDIWWIQSVYVHPDFRRRGIFTALHKHAAVAAGAAGAIMLRLYVHEENTGAQETYQRLGMSLTHYKVMEQPLKSSG